MGLSLNELRVRPHIFDRGLVVRSAPFAHDVLDFAATTDCRSNGIRNMPTPFHLMVHYSLEENDRISRLFALDLFDDATEFACVKHS